MLGSHSNGKVVWRAPAILAPDFSLACALWIPRVMIWDSETGFFECADWPRSGERF